MPKATLTYTLPDENMDHRAALAGVDALIAMERIDNWARGILKHGNPTDGEAKMLEELRQMIPYNLLEILE